MPKSCQTPNSHSIKTSSLPASIQASIQHNALYLDDGRCVIGKLNPHIGKLPNSKPIQTHSQPPAVTKAAA